MARTDTTIEVTVASWERVRTTRMGNPVYDLHTVDGRRYRMQSDTSFAYEATNHRSGTRLELTLTAAGRIRYGKALWTPPRF